VSEVGGSTSASRPASVTVMRALVFVAIAVVLGSAAFGAWSSWRVVVTAAPGIIAGLEPAAAVESVSFAGPWSFLVRFTAADDSSLQGSVYVVAPWFDDAIIYSDPRYDPAP